MPQTSHPAIAVTSPGTLQQITLPTLSPAADEVLIEVEYAALVPVDVYQIDTAFFVQEYPHVIGFTSAGRVAAVGDNINDLKVGDKVSQCFEVLFSTKAHSLLIQLLRWLPTTFQLRKTKDCSNLPLSPGSL